MITSRTGVLHITDAMCPGSMYLEARVGGVLVNATVDTGASVSLVHASVFKSMPSDIQQRLRPHSGTLSTANGGSIQPIGKVDLVVSFRTDIENIVIDMTHIFIVAPDINCQCILGTDFLQEYVASHSYETDCLEMRL